MIPLIRNPKNKTNRNRTKKVVLCMCVGGNFKGVWGNVLGSWKCPTSFCIHGAYMGLYNYQHLSTEHLCILLSVNYTSIKKKKSWGLGVNLPYLALFREWRYRRNKFASQLTILGAEAQQPAELPPQCPLGNIWGKKRFSGGNWYTLNEALLLAKRVSLKCLQQCLLPHC